MSRLATALVAALVSFSTFADPPAGFEESIVISGLQDPSTMAFAPDGRLFIAERIVGRLRVANYDDATGTWSLNTDPFYSFDIPNNGGTPTRHRSSGLRGFAFDPDFATNGYVYCFYMKHDPRHNRVVRLQADPANPDIALPGETLLFEMPFNDSDSSGSHNGGAVVIGADNKLFVTTGDGWNGGDNVQSLSTFTGKLFRLNRDGTIPTDNPFYMQTTGDFRAIYALGLRNPYSIARHPASDTIYINDVTGSNKASVFAVAPGANFGHDGYDGIGTQTGTWANAGGGGSAARVISGGAWYPACGPFPSEYFGRYFAALWGSNSSSSGAIRTIASEIDTTTTSFGDTISHPDPLGVLKPVYTAVSPAGDLYYLATNYEAEDGVVVRIRATDPIGNSLDIFVDGFNGPDAGMCTEACSCLDDDNDGDLDLHDAAAWQRAPVIAPR